MALHSQATSVLAQLAVASGAMQDVKALLESSC
jgi:hypothetical protein